MKRTMLIAAVLVAALVFPNVVSARDADTPQTSSMTSMTAAELEARGDILRAERNYPEAVRYYKAVLQKNPKNSVLWNKVGVVELKSGHDDAAETYFQKALKYGAKNDHALNNMGVVAFGRKNYGKAVKYYKKALAIDETNATYHSNLGTAWFTQNKLDRAMAEYTRAMELDPEVFNKSNQGGSIARVSTTEDRAKYEFMLARLYAQRGDIEACIHWIQKAKEDGYNVKDIYKETDFAKVRQDPRLAQIVPPPASTGY